ncbi:uncharacterized protein B0T23DRAFT_381602 [Neurospora hispaniola]|uniref:Uncharacterized protein n=1 Tax=Neurospora hispaniola TaxID=588809 RepID=A0AAJ0MQ08_9PEZI|nr:hypothetical protein B0T23DRAFT_381602 [Neurospora hispaniola]
MSHTSQGTCSSTGSSLERSSSPLSGFIHSSPIGLADHRAGLFTFTGTSDAMPRAAIGGCFRGGASSHPSYQPCEVNWAGLALPLSDASRVRVDGASSEWPDDSISYGFSLLVGGRQNRTSCVFACFASHAPPPPYRGTLWLELMSGNLPVVGGRKMETVQETRCQKSGSVYISDLLDACFSTGLFPPLGFQCIGMFERGILHLQANRCFLQ